MVLLGPQRQLSLHETYRIESFHFETSTEKLDEGTNTLAPDVACLRISHMTKCYRKKRPKWL